MIEFTERQSAGSQCRCAGQHGQWHPSRSLLRWSAENPAQRSAIGVTTRRIWRQPVSTSSTRTAAGQASAFAKDRTRSANAESYSGGRRRIHRRERRWPRITPPQTPASKTSQKWYRQPNCRVRRVSTLMRIQSAFEKAAIRFLDNDAGGGIGVRLAAPKP